MVNRDNSVSPLSVECTAIMATAYTMDGAQGISNNANPMVITVSYSVYTLN